MASPFPRPSSGKASVVTRSNGVLAIPASATQKRTSSMKPFTKVTAPRMKILIRRLPPGLTSTEFENGLGEEWRATGERVDWVQFKPGKVSKDPAKPSRPSRAYLHLTREEHINHLADRVRHAIFNDAKGSVKDGALLGPPTVEFAPYGRVPNSRGRKDLRQGTIDQDQEFIDFLESLTSPISKPAPVDQGTDSAGKIKEKVTVTPLVQYLKDKKANKGKEITIASKTTKHTRQDSKDSKTSTIEKRPSSKASNPILSPEKRSAQALKVEKAARDVVRVISKQALTTTKGSTSPSTSTTTTSTTTTTPIPNPSVANVTPIEKKRERGSMSAAAKILQRDLGLGGSPGGRGGRRGPPSKPATNASNPAVPKQDSSPVESSKVTVANNTIASTNDEAKTLVNSTNKPSINSQPPRGPATSSGSPRTPSSSGPKSGHSGPANNIVKNTISPTATQAFLKHANPSQGITEPLLEQAFSEFGVVKKVEIDKKKGFAYVDFAEPQGLQDAVKASPIKVASGQVVVLERKTGPTLQARNARGRSYVMMGNRGGGTPTGPRGGRGGSVKRGGLGRGGANAAHPTIYKAPTTGPTTSQATIAAPAADPAVSQSSTETNIGLPAPTPIEVIDNTPDA